MKKTISIIILVGVILCSFVSCGKSNSEETKNAIDFTGKINRERERYIAMSVQDLSKLSNEDLYEAVIARTDNIVEKYTDQIEGFKHLSDFQMVVYAASIYELEMANGGLCQCLVNSSGELAPVFSDAFSEIGAEEHRELFERFLTENNIDVYDLTSFVCKNEKEYEAQRVRFDYDSYDVAYYKLPPLTEYIVRYAREHLESL